MKPEDLQSIMYHRRAQNMSFTELLDMYWSEVPRVIKKFSGSSPLHVWADGRSCSHRAGFINIHGEDGAPK